MKLSNRLLCCADLTPSGARVADIGADHGYLGIYLLQSGRASFVHASELRLPPLHRAMRNALRYGVAGKMRFSQADGLAAIDPAEADAIVCAGMGGDLIAQILGDCAWLKDPRYLLILQPQSSGSGLRRWLAENGFGIRRETLAEDGGFLYNVFTARYGNPVFLTPGQQYAPPLLLESGSPLLPQYLARIEAALARTVAGLQRAIDPAATEKRNYYEAALKEIRGLPAFREAAQSQEVSL